MLPRAAGGVARRFACLLSGSIGDATELGTNRHGVAVASENQSVGQGGQLVDEQEGILTRLRRGPAGPPTAVHLL